jgi:hypothetical protein
MRLPLTRSARWTGEGEDVHPGDVLVLIVAVVGFVVLFFAGIL